jgi:hypothetical protein
MIKTRLGITIPSYPMSRNSHAKLKAPTFNHLRWVVWTVFVQFRQDSLPLWVDAKATGGINGAGCSHYFSLYLGVE